MDKDIYTCKNCEKPIKSGQPTFLTLKGFVHNIDACKPERLK